MNERKMLRAIAMQAAYDAGIDLTRWMKEQAHVSPSSFNKMDWKPSLPVIYRICDAAGVKVSDYFKRIGR